ncbi:ADP-ribosylation factor [Cyclospora cayetanensis]|uniref:ADP-ribosylation factor n=1 Tax=Cyclospora cayetanensis TaxID=88456 RepID=A0A1D3CV85_9EIME|nr:ADP-ribosylation factor [Cyclospora cayetanensis]
MGCCPSRYSGVRDGGSGLSSPPQIAFLGLDGSGKTTLMYKTLIPEWVGIAGSLPPTSAFHYERLQRGKLQIGMWDLSGALALRGSWSAFYRYVDLWCVVYVINLLETQEDRLTENKAILMQLANEACLKAACIVVVLNTMGTPPESAPVPPSQLVSRLGLYEVASTEGQRIKWFVVDCRKGETDPQWAEAFRFILDRFHRIIYPPPPPPKRKEKKGGAQEGVPVVPEDADAP